MSDLAAQLRALDTEGTPLPWERFGMGGITSPLMDVAPEFHATCGECGADAGIVVPLSAEDAALIVALRNNTPEIVAALETVARMREFLEAGATINALAYKDIRHAKSYRAACRDALNCLNEQPEHIWADDEHFTMRALDGE